MLTPTQDRLWTILSAANGNIVDYDTLITQALLRESVLPADHQTLYLFLNRLRRSTGADIRNAYGRGYYLANAGHCPECKRPFTSAELPVTESKTPDAIPSHQRVFVQR